MEHPADKQPIASSGSLEMHSACQELLSAAAEVQTCNYTLLILNKINYSKQCFNRSIMMGGWICSSQAVLFGNYGIS